MTASPLQHLPSLLGEGYDAPPTHRQILKAIAKGHIRAHQEGNRWIVDDVDAVVRHFRLKTTQSPPNSLWKLPYPSLVGRYNAPIPTFSQIYYAVIDDHLPACVMPFALIVDTDNVVRHFRLTPRKDARS